MSPQVQPAHEHLMVSCWPDHREEETHLSPHWHEPVEQPEQPPWHARMGEVVWGSATAQPGQTHGSEHCCLCGVRVRQVWLELELGRRDAGEGPVI